MYRKTAQYIRDVLTCVGATYLLVDMQDVGVRLYTFVWTMYDVIQAVLPSNHTIDGHAVKIVVLDRPNPLGGDVVEVCFLPLVVCLHSCSAV